MSETNNQTAQITCIPTMRLRFVMRHVPEVFADLRILQQAYVVAETGSTIWHDVPLETEAE